MDSVPLLPVTEPTALENINNTQDIIPSQNTPAAVDHINNNQDLTPSQNTIEENPSGNLLASSQTQVESNNSITLTTRYLISHVSQNPRWH